MHKCNSESAKKEEEDTKINNERPSYKEKKRKKLRERRKFENYME